MKHRAINANSDNIYRTVYQSVDYAIKEHLEMGEDPLALASYLWTFRQHQISSIRSDGLVTWGISWVQRVFVEQQIGQRKDEEIASAALAVIALEGTKSFSVVREGVRDGVNKLLMAELDLHSIPFRRPSYAAMLLLAAQVLQITNSRVQGAAQEIGKAYSLAISGGRLFGLAFCVRLLVEMNMTEFLDDLLKRSRTALANPSTAYEDNVYLLQALWQLPHEEASVDQTLKTTEQVLAKSPAWAYLMVGMEDIPSVSDGDAVVKVSHLFRASLLDVTILYQTNAARRSRSQEDARLQGRRGVSLLAYGSPLLFFTVVWGLYIYLMIPALDAGRRFWLNGEDNSMTPSNALFFLGGVLLLPYLLIITPVILTKLYKILIRGNIQSDQRIINELWKPTWKITAGWLTLVLLAVVINFATGALASRMQRVIDLLNNK